MEGQAADIARCVRVNDGYSSDYNTDFTGNCAGTKSKKTQIF